MEATAIIYDHADDIADFFDRSDDRLFDRLPTTIAESAPPELQHLVEIKRMYEGACEQRGALGHGRTGNRDLIDQRHEATAPVNQIGALNDDAYERYQESGQLTEATAFLDLWEQAGALALARRQEMPMADNAPGQTAGGGPLHTAWNLRL